MDSTLWTIFVVLLIAFGWLIKYTIDVNRNLKSKEKRASVKEALFGKKKPKKHPWNFAD
jgi:hypothetical protein